MNLRSRAFAENPYPSYRALREAGGAHFLPAENAWLVVSYELVSSTLRKSSVFSSAPFAEISPSLHGADGSDHRSFRRLLSPFFSRENVESQRECIEQVAEEMVSELRSRPRFDAISDFASPFPFRVACAWLGIDESVAAELQEIQVSEVIWEKVRPSLRSDGLLMTLARTGSFTEPQLAELAGFFLLAGVSTARDFVLFALHTLLREPGALAKALDHGANVRLLVDELLRFEAPVHTLARTTREAVVMGDHEIPAGATIWVSIGAANRDPEVFENPDEFNPARAPNPHLSFGIGPHFCLGSHLGWLEGEAVLAALLPHVADLRENGPSPRIEFGGLPAALPSMRRMNAWSLTFRGSR